MRTKIITISALVVIGLALTAQVSSTVSYQLPVWSSGKYMYPSLGPAFKITGGVIDVPVTQGPVGPSGAIGPAGPIGESGVFFAAPNDVYVLTLPQSTFPLKCAMADVFRNGMMSTSTAEGGVDIAVDPVALTVTFLGTMAPQPGDVVKITYRCSAR